jgi:hypothetical protein
MDLLSSALVTLRFGGFSLPVVLAWAFTSLVIYVIISHRKTRIIGGVAAAYPPGPRADPVIGHARFIPTQYAWITLSEWARKFGE